MIDWLPGAEDRIRKASEYVERFDPNAPCDVQIVSGIGPHGNKETYEDSQFPDHDTAWEFAKQKASELEADGWAIFWNPSANPTVDPDWDRDLDQLESWVWEARKRVRDQMTTFPGGAYDDRDDWQMLHIFGVDPTDKETS